MTDVLEYKYCAATMNHSGLCSFDVDTLGGCYAGTCRAWHAGGSTTSNTHSNDTSAAAAGRIGTCECWPGWSGATDYIPTDMAYWGGPVMACTVHDATVMVLWGLGLIPVLLQLSVFVPLLREQHKVHRRHRRRTQGRRETIVPCTMFQFVAVHLPLEIVTSLALVCLKLAPGRATGSLLGIHALPTFLFFVNSVNMNVALAVNDLHLIATTMAAAKAKPAEISRVQHGRLRVVLIQLPLDFALLVSSFIPPAPPAHSTWSPRNTWAGAASVGAGAAAATEWWEIYANERWTQHRIVFMLRLIHLGVNFGMVIWWTRSMLKRVGVMFNHILGLPMDDGPRTQVKGLRDRILQGNIKMIRSSVVLIVAHALLAFPLWWTLMFTYYQPLGRAMISMAEYGLLRSWGKIGAAKVAGTVLTSTRSIITSRISRSRSHEVVPCPSEGSLTRITSNPKVVPLLTLPSTLHLNSAVGGIGEQSGRVLNDSKTRQGSKNKPSASVVPPGAVVATVGPIPQFDEAAKDDDLRTAELQRALA